MVGGLGLLTNLWTAVSTLFFGMLADMPGQAAMFKAMDQYRVWTIASGLLAATCSLLLLIASIGVVQRRRWAVRAVFVWAAAKLVAVPFSAVVTYLMQVAQFKAMASDPAFAGNPAIRGGAFGVMGGAVGVVTAIFMICWGWALPLFMVVWLTRKRIRQETAAWR